MDNHAREVTGYLCRWLLLAASLAISFRVVTLIMRGLPQSLDAIHGWAVAGDAVIGENRRSYPNIFFSSPPAAEQLELFYARTAAGKMARVVNRPRLPSLVVLPPEHRSGEFIVLPNPYAGRLLVGRGAQLFPYPQRTEMLVLDARALPPRAILDNLAEQRDIGFLLPQPLSQYFSARKYLQTEVLLAPALAASRDWDAPAPASPKPAMDQLRWITLQLTAPPLLVTNDAQLAQTAAETGYTAYLLGAAPIRPHQRLRLARDWSHLADMLETPD